jgi:formylglycine-generating enzyme required for sulfatase activity
MAGKIFINYRRGESLKDAQLLATLLTKPFGAKQIFLDVHGIDGGANWLHTIEQQVASSDAMVALIEKGWAERKDEHGSRRLDNPDDFVRFEVAQALQRNIPVLPVLLDGAPMPRASELPAQMLALTLFQAMPMRAESVVRDADAIAQRLQVLLAKKRQRGVPGWVLGLSAATALALGIVAGPFLLSQMRLPALGIPPPGEGQGAQQDLQRQLDAARAEAKQGQERLTKAAQDLEQAQQDRDAAKAALAAAQRDLEGAKAKIADLEKKLLAGKETPAKAQGQAGSDPALAMTPGSGQSFRDRLANGEPCPLCPELVVVPNGSFTMGSPESEPKREKGETQVGIRIARPFAVGKFTLTRGEFAAFLQATGYQMEGCDYPHDKSFRDPGFLQDDRHPVVCVDWDDAKQYAAWLSKATGRNYRLLSETEREYVTRAGTTTAYWPGASITPAQANFDGTYGYTGHDVFRRRTVPVDSFAPNPWGLYNVHGNVWEWTEDCWNDSNAGNPGDGTARSGDCGRRIVRGGSWTNVPAVLRSAFRFTFNPRYRHYGLGFRLARRATP